MIYDSIISILKPLFEERSESITGEKDLLQSDVSNAVEVNKGPIAKLKTEKANLSVLKTALKAKNYTSAINYCKNLLELNDTHYLYYFLYAICLDSCNHDEYSQQIKEAYAKAHELNPSLAKSYITESAALNQKSDYQTAITLLQLAIALDPANIDAIYQLAASYAGNQQYDEAIANCQKITTRNPQYTQSFFLLGQSFYANNQPEQAIKAYQMAIEQNDPKITAAAWLNLSEIYTSMSHLDKRLEAIKVAIEQGELYDKAVAAIAYQKLGSFYAEQGELDDAINAYQKVIELANEAKDKARAYFNLGNIYYIQRNYIFAKQYYKNALKIKDIEPSEAIKITIDTRFQLACLYDEQQKFPKSIALFQSVIDMAENVDLISQVEAYHNLGLVQRKQRKYPEAIKSFQKAIKKAKEECRKMHQAQSYRELGFTYYVFNNMPHAIEAFNHAITISREHKQSISPIVYQKLGEAYYRKNLYQLAEKQFSQILKEQHNDETKFEARYWLVKILKKQNQYADALETLQECDISNLSQKKLAQLHYQRGKIYLTNNNNTEAAAAFQKAAELSSEIIVKISASANYYLGFIMYSQKDTEKAIHYLNLAIEMSSHLHPKLRNSTAVLLIQAYEQEEQYQEAYNLFQQFSENKELIEALEQQKQLALYCNNKSLTQKPVLPSKRLASNVGDPEAGQNKRTKSVHFADDVDYSHAESPHGIFSQKGWRPTSPPNESASFPCQTSGYLNNQRI